jgi:hypothetical protein
MELVILGIIIGAVGHWAYNKYLGNATHTLEDALVKVEQEAKQEIVKVEEKIKEEVVKVEEKVKRPRKKAGTTAV